MGVMDMAAPLIIDIGVQAEQDLHSLAPIGPIPIRVKEPQIKLHVLTIIRRERLALRRLVQKVRRRSLHDQSPYSPFENLLTKWPPVIDP